ncbi:MAG: DUF4160 domain-containing protein [Aquisalimonadaceae bacterium]
MVLEQEAKDLQRRFAQVDLLSGESSSGYIEFLVHKRRNIKIKMYQEKGHYVPHVHIDYGHSHHAATYTIEYAQRIAGSLDKKYDREVTAWISSCREQLQDIWDTTQAGKNSEELVAELRGEGEHA